MSNPLLSGLRILDLSRLLPGPFCTLQLAQLGAEVIKIEEPDGGDYTRALSPALFNIVNRGKKSVTLDLRLEGDVERFKEMVKHADVVIESFRPGVMDKLGCGYDTLKAVNPKLVYASLTGYGQTGPYRDRPGHDLNYLGYAGVLDQTGLSGKRPGMSNVQIADLAGGALTCALGILAAVQGAQKSGAGCWVDAGMLDGTLALQTMAMATLHEQGQTFPRGKDFLTGALPNYNLYRCRDGKYLAVGALEPKFFLKFLREITPQWLWGKKKTKRPPTHSTSNTTQAGKTSSNNDMGALTSLSKNPTKARWVLMPLRWIIAGVLITRTRDYWEKRLGDADACISASLTLEEAMQSEQVKARGLIETRHGKPMVKSALRFVGAETFSGDSPALGEHNDEINVAGQQRRA
ncbi:MAG: CaiB/BaiF CoA-transferase family protein [Alcanivoracaceae bacterium]|nr:CaiB/BaiF CoA-transferase family protein [Alcanivoracaceae bacterium]